MDERRKPAARREEADPGDADLTFPDLPRMELDELLTELAERAQEVIRTQGRLRSLLHANRTIMADLAADVVLQRIVDAACAVVGARYAALGVLDGHGGLAEFIHSGMPPEQVAAIPHPPVGEGLLGALIDDPRPIRLHDLTADPRSSGFPPGHPAMRSFLGVPIRIRDDVFGNLYLTESTRGSFTAEDEELARSLAATAAVVVDNARQYEAARRHSEWQAATADITRATLVSRRAPFLRAVAEHAQRLAEADLVAVLLPDAQRHSLQVATAVGSESHRDAAAALVGHRSPVGNSLCAHVFTTGEALRLADAGSPPGLPPAVLAEAVDAGPVMVVPLAGTTRTSGVLALARRRGRATFRPDDLQIAAGFAAQAALALDLADARAERERAAMLDDRERIAGDLHDHVIQRIFACGLALHSLAAHLDPADAGLLRSVVEDLDDTISRIRSSIFALHEVGIDTAGSVRAELLAVIAGAAAALGHTPHLQFSGPVDMLLGTLDPVARTALVDDVCAVAREALSNVARHAAAAAVQVELAVAGEDGGPRLVLSIADDGLGMRPSDRRDALATLRRRAERRGGHLTIAEVDPHGTRIEWSVPLGPPARDG